MFDSEHPDAYVVTYGTIYSHPQLRNEYGLGQKRTLVVRAKSPADAFCVAYDFLTREGHRVRWAKRRSTAASLRSDSLFQEYWLLPDDEWAEVLASGVPAAVGTELGMDGDVTICKIEPHVVRVTGRVLAQCQT